MQARPAFSDHTSDHTKHLTSLLTVKADQLWIAASHRIIYRWQRVTERTEQPVKGRIRRHSNARTLALQDREVFDMAIRMHGHFTLGQVIEPRHSVLNLGIASSEDLHLQTDNR